MLFPVSYFSEQFLIQLSGLVIIFFSLLAIFLQLSTELNRRLSQLSVTPSGPIKTESATGDTRSVDYRTMETMFKDSVTVFKPGLCVNKFIILEACCLQIAYIFWLSLLNPPENLRPIE